MLHSVDRVVVAVRELDRAVPQYVRLLGRTPSWRGEQPVAGTQNSLFRLENTTLELVAPIPQGSAGRIVSSDSASRAAWTAESLGAWMDSQGEGMLALVFRTDDGEAFRGAAAERGLQPGPLEKEIDRDVESGAFREWRSISLSQEATRGVSLSAVECVSADEGVPLAAPLGSEDASVFAIDHAVVQTRDSDATRKLYGENLGLRLALEREFPQWGSRLQFFRVGGVTIEVAASSARDPEHAVDAADAIDATVAKSVAADAPADRDRLWGLCWRVRDADSAQERLRSVGFDVSQVRDGRKHGTRVFTVRDGTCGVPTLVLEPAQS